MDEKRGSGSSPASSRTEGCSAMGAAEAALREGVVEAADAAHWVDPEALCAYWARVQGRAQ